MANIHGLEKCKEGMEGARHIDGIKIEIYGEVIEAVERFTYLGAVDNINANMVDEISSRKQRMNFVFQQFSSRVFRNSNVKVGTKLAVYSAYVIPCGLFACETWFPTQQDIDTLETTHFQLLKRILFKPYQRMFISHMEVINCINSYNLSVYPLEVYIRQQHLRYLGHILRQPTGSILRSVLFSRVARGSDMDQAEQGLGKRCGPRSTLKAAWKLLNFRSYEQWYEIASGTASKDQYRKILYQ
jgi:hypothetical protein